MTVGVSDAAARTVGGAVVAAAEPTAVVLTARMVTAGLTTVVTTRHAVLVLHQTLRHQLVRAAQTVGAAGVLQAGNVLGRDLAHGVVVRVIALAAALHDTAVLLHLAGRTMMVDVVRPRQLVV